MSAAGEVARLETRASGRGWPSRAMASLFLLACNCGEMVPQLLLGGHVIRRAFRGTVAVMAAGVGLAAAMAGAAASTDDGSGQGGVPLHPVAVPRRAAEICTRAAVDRPRVVRQI